MVALRRSAWGLSPVGSWLVAVSLDDMVSKHLCLFSITHFVWLIVQALWDCLERMRYLGQILPCGPHLAWTFLRTLVLISFISIHWSIQLLASLETLFWDALVRYICKALGIWYPRREPTFHFGSFLHVSVNIHDMFNVLLHYILCNLLVVMLRWVPYLLGLLKFLLANRGVSWFDHILRLLFFDWSQLRARLVLWAHVALLSLIVLILLLDLHDLVLWVRGWLLRILRVLRHRVILLV